MFKLEENETLLIKCKLYLLEYRAGDYADRSCREKGRKLNFLCISELLRK